MYIKCYLSYSDKSCDFEVTLLYIIFDIFTSKLTHHFLSHFHCVQRRKNVASQTVKWLTHTELFPKMFGKY